MNRLLIAPLTERRIVSFASWVTIAAAVIAGAVAPAGAVRICDWHHDAVSAVSYTFDDGLQSQLDHVVPELERAEIPATFFLVTSRVEEWQPWRLVAQGGHEIGSHSLSHKGFRGYIRNYKERRGSMIEPMVFIEEELRLSKEQIETEIPGQACVSYAYAYCQTDEADNFIDSLYVAARGCGRATSADPAEDIVRVNPPDIYKIAAVLNDREGAALKTATLNSFVWHAMTNPQWLVFGFHGVEDDSSWCWAHIDTLALHWQFVKSQGEKLWVTTFGNAARYIAQRQCASVTEHVTDDSISLSCTDTLSNDGLYNHPLTACRKIPAGWTSILAQSESGEAVWHSVKNDSIYFAIVPDGPRVQLLNGGTVRSIRGSAAPRHSGPKQEPASGFSPRGRKLQPGPGGDRGQTSGVILSGDGKKRRVRVKE